MNAAVVDTEVVEETLEGPHLLPEVKEEEVQENIELVQPLIAVQAIREEMMTIARLEIAMGEVQARQAIAVEMTDVDTDK